MKYILVIESDDIVDTVFACAPHLHVSCVSDESVINDLNHIAKKDQLTLHDRDVIVKAIGGEPHFDKS